MTALVTFMLGALSAAFGMRRLVGARVTRGVRLTLERQERRARVRRFVLYVKIAGALLVVFTLALLAVAR